MLLVVLLVVMLVMAMMPSMLSLFHLPSQGPSVTPDGPPQDFHYAEHDSANPCIVDEAPSLPYVTQDNFHNACWANPSYPETYEATYHE